MIQAYQKHPNAQKIYFIANATIVSLFLLFNPTVSFAKKEYDWLCASGSWQKYVLDNGNYVAKNTTLRYTNYGKYPPDPWHNYHTLRLLPWIQKKVHGANLIRFQFNVDRNPGEGKMAIFLSGRNQKELNFVEFTLKNYTITRIRLFHSFEKDKNKPATTYGNYRISLIDSEPVSIPVRGQQTLNIVRNKTTLLLQLNRNTIFRFNRNKVQNFDYYPNLIFAISGKDIGLWIDNVVIAHNQRILFRDNFTKAKIMRYYMKVRIIDSRDNSIPSAPK